MRPWPCGILGYPDQALQTGQRGGHLAQELSHPIAWLCPELVAELHHFRREGKRPGAGRGLMALATEQRFAFWLVRGTMLRGWALAEQGQGERG